MSHLLEIVRANESAIGDIAARRPDHLTAAIQLLDRLDHLATVDPDSAGESLGVFLLQLPGGASLFADLIGDVRLRPGAAPKPAQIAEAIRLVKNVFVRAAPPSKEEEAFAILTAPPKPAAAKGGRS